MALFTASSGTRIGYEEEGSGIPLVLLHGLMAHRGFFDPQRVLARDFRLILIDIPGHGASVTEGGAPEIEAIAADIGELVAHLGIEGAVGVGWSLGATILWHLLAGSSGDRFGGAVVIDMTPRVLNDEDWQLGLSREHCDARSAAIEEDFAAFAAAAGQAIFAQPVASELEPAAAWAGAEFARNDPAAMASLWTSLVAQDCRPLLRRIPHPTLIVRGAHSHLYGSDTAEHLAAALPNARIVEFDRSGHAPHLEQPELFNRTIADFAATLPSEQTAKTAA